MCDKHGGESLAFPKRAQLSIEFVTRHFIKRAEGFIKEQRVGL